jgi:hypothetical protein
MFSGNAVLVHPPRLIFLSAAAMAAAMLTIDVEK